MAGRSYPWYCQRLREQAGLVLDDELLRRMARGERYPLHSGRLALRERSAYSLAADAQAIVADNPEMSYQRLAGKEG